MGRIRWECNWVFEIVLYVELQKGLYKSVNLIIPVGIPKFNTVAAVSVVNSVACLTINGTTELRGTKHIPATKTRSTLCHVFNFLKLVPLMANV